MTEGVGVVWILGQGQEKPSKKWWHVIPGLVWLNSVISKKDGKLYGTSQALIVSARTIKKGTKRGLIEVIEPRYNMKGRGEWVLGKRHIVEARSIIRFPEEKSKSLLTDPDPGVADEVLI